VNENLTRLLSLQEKDREIVARRSDAAEIPKRRDALAAKEKDTGARLEAEKKTLETVRKDRRAREQEIEGLVQEVKKFEVQTFSVKTNKELDALKHEIAARKDRQREIENRVLELMELEEGAGRRLAEAERTFAAAKAALAKEGDALRAEEARMAEEVARLGGERRELAAQVDVALRSKYETIFRGKGPTAVVPLDKEACRGCGVRQPPQRVQDVRKNDRIIQCESCGRILYSAAEAG
jgi:predicted  nucleic acid-binding Zn-ribbon protein